MANVAFFIAGVITHKTNIPAALTFNSGNPSTISTVLKLTVMYLGLPVWWLQWLGALAIGSQILLKRKAS